MKRILYSIIVTAISLSSMAQVYTDSTVNMSAKRVQYADIQQFAIGSYGEAHFNKEVNFDKRTNGKADLHRIITYLGYRFNDRLQFFSEIEFEHVDEIYVEQAFFNYRFNDKFNFKAGQLLIPMGYVNEFHEPTLFNGVERPTMDAVVIPSTWRELGFGFQGLFKDVNIKYQLYAVNSSLGYDGSAKLSGKGIRSSRQGGGNSIMRQPAVTGKISYYGISGLLLEASAYVGQTESTLNNSLSDENPVLISQADSSMVGISMAGIHAMYNLNKFQFRGQAYYTALSNTMQYNAFTGSDVANGIIGYYGEFSYTFDLKKNDYLQLVPFVRYESYDTHFSVDNSIAKDKNYNKQEIFVGAGLRLAPGMIIKTDMQFITSEATTDYKTLYNLGFGYWF